MSTRRRVMEASAVAGAGLTSINQDNVAARFDAARA